MNTKIEETFCCLQIRLPILNQRVNLKSLTVHKTYSSVPSFIKSIFYCNQINVYDNFQKEYIQKYLYSKGAQIPSTRSLWLLNIMMAPNICESSVGNMVHVTLLVPRILRWFLEFSKICALLQYTFFPTHSPLHCTDCSFEL